MVPFSLNLHILIVSSQSYEEYEPEEPDFDEDEPFEPVDPDDVENRDGSSHRPLTTGDSPDDPDAKLTNGDEGNIVDIRDPNQAAGAVKKNAVVGLREKKIPNDKRSTTPYMTKYERARVLGTRALQIRYVNVSATAIFGDASKAVEGPPKKAGFLWIFCHP